LLTEGLGLDVKLQDLEDFRGSALPKINYSSEPVGGLQISPHGILFDFGIKDYSTEVNNHPLFFKIFFRTHSGDLPFDIFGAAFWLISRYEEYLPHKTDNFNRFHYKNSLGYQYDFLQIPLVNLWLLELKKALLLKFPQLKITEKKFSFISTIDIDNAYKYKYKGLVRTMAGYMSDLLKRDFNEIKQRTRILLNRQEDPFDCYDFLIEANRKSGVKSIYFFLLGDYGVNDKNHSASNLDFQALIKHLSDYAAIGIHPSFGSTGNLHQLKVEISRLSQITHRQISKSRQHFSILKFPETYQFLLQSDITHDYSMGYTNFNGFRAAFCYPFKWYSIDDESSTSLMVHPFSVSENTAEYYQSREKSSFMQQVLPIIVEVKKYGGELISIFHNNTLNAEMKENYLDFLKAVRSASD
jgi:hypothetical protein